MSEARQDAAAVLQAFIDEWRKKGPRGPAPYGFSQAVGRSDVLNALQHLIASGKLQSAPAAEMRFAVFPGSEKIDLGDKRVACLCSSEPQAKHMAAFWEPYGYYERLSR